jgi:hypothetical protein
MASEPALVSEVSLLDFDDSLGDAADAVRMALIDGRLELDNKGVFTFESTRRAGIDL